MAGLLGALIVGSLGGETHVLDHNLTLLRAGSRFHAVPHRYPQLLALMGILTSAVVPRLCAQQGPVLERGSQIEIVSELLAEGIAVGRLETLTKDTLTFANASGTTALALTDIGQIRVNVGRSISSLNVATLMGAMVGMAAAVVTAPADHECLSSLAYAGECSEEVPVELVGALLGAGAFRILAALTTEEGWETVQLDRLIYFVRAVDLP